MRCGRYFRNFYLGYTGLYSFFFNEILHGVEAGYSLFLGQRKTWPPESVRRRAH
jgi:hypothetical protein